MPWLLDAVLLVASSAVFFSGSWLFFVKKIAGNYGVRDRRVLTLFAATFSLSATLFELIIFEIVDVLNRTLRWFMWKTTLVLMLSLLIVILPLYQIRLLIVGNNRGNIIHCRFLLSFHHHPCRLEGQKCSDCDSSLLGIIHLGLLEGRRSFSNSKQGTWLFYPRAGHE